MYKITSAVGKDQKNTPSDIKTVQRLLAIASINQGKKDWNPTSLSGNSETFKAIIAFQKALRILPNGIIKPGDETLNKLNNIANAAQYSLKRQGGLGRAVIIAKSNRRREYNSDGSHANDMKYGDYTKEQIKNIRGIFKVDDAIVDLDTVSAKVLFDELEFMATSLFAFGSLDKTIRKMIAAFKRSNGDDFSDPDLTRAVKSHYKVKKLEHEIAQSLSNEIKRQKGVLFETPTFTLQTKLAFNSKPRDLLNGLTICINDVWAYKIEIIDYEFDGIAYKGKYRVTLYDHFGLDQPDVDKFYGFGAGFRAWFILQHLDRFAYRPFVTVVEFENSFSGDLI